MSILNIKRVTNEPSVLALEPSTLYIVKSSNSQYVELLITGESVDDYRRVVGNGDISAAIAVAMQTVAPKSHVGAVGNAHGVATDEAAGFMSAADKAKLDGLPVGTNVVLSVSGRTGVVTLTKADVGLDQVDNTSDADKPVSTAVQTELDNTNLLKADLLSPVFTGKPMAPTPEISADDSIATTLYTHLAIATEATPIEHDGSTGDAHGVATQTTAGFMSALDKKLLDDLEVATSTAVVSVAGRTGVVSLTPEDIGLDLVDNTSDADKPVSGPQSDALALKADTASPTFTGVPTAPTAADNTSTDQVATTKFVMDGLITYAGVTSVSGKTGAVTLTKADVGLGNVTNTADIDKALSTATINALNTKAGLSSPVFTGVPTAPTAVLGGQGDKSLANTEYVRKTTNGVLVKTLDGVAIILSDSETGHSILKFNGHIPDDTIVAFSYTTTGNWIIWNDTTGGFKIKLRTLTHGDVGVDLSSKKSILVFIDDTGRMRTGSSEFVIDATTVVPTAASGTSTGQIASTKFVVDEINTKSTPASHVGSNGASHAEATDAAAGFMSSADKVKLDTVQAGAQANTVSSVNGLQGAVVINKTTVGLGNVNNTADADKPLGANQVITTQSMIDASSTPLTHVGSGGVSHSPASDTVAGFMTAADKVKLDAIETTAQRNTVHSVNGKAGLVVIDKTDIGLANVDNTSDADKPVPAAVNASLALKAPLASPVFTGSPKAVTVNETNDSDIIATTAFVRKSAKRGWTINDYVEITDANTPSKTLTLDVNCIGKVYVYTGQATSFNINSPGALTRTMWVNLPSLTDYDSIPYYGGTVTFRTSTDVNYHGGFRFNTDTVVGGYYLPVGGYSVTFVYKRNTLTNKGVWVVLTSDATVSLVTRWQTRVDYQTMKIINSRKTDSDGWFSFRGIIDLGTIPASTGGTPVVFTREISVLSVPDNSVSTGQVHLNIPTAYVYGPESYYPNGDPVQSIDVQVNVDALHTLSNKLHVTCYSRTPVETTGLRLAWLIDSYQGTINQVDYQG